MQQSPDLPPACFFASEAVILKRRIQAEASGITASGFKSPKEQTDQLFYGMTCIVDRYTVVDLMKDRYEYHEYNSDNLYPETGSYQNLLDTASEAISYYPIQKI